LELNDGEKGFAIKDKRFSADKEGEGARSGKKGDGGISLEGNIPLPELNFTTFILSLSSSAMLHFGDIEDPVSGKKEKNLLMAKHTIDMIDMLREKTKGNLSGDEERLMENILCELKLRYVKESKRGI
jgi:hypothetical protein